MLKLQLLISACRILQSQQRVVQFQSKRFRIRIRRLPGVFLIRPTAYKSLCTSGVLRFLSSSSAYGSAASLPIRLAN